MTKLNLMLTSLVAAIPAALLSYFIVMVFLNYGLPDTMLLVIASGTLAAAVITAVLPVGIAIFQPKEASAAAPPVEETEFDPESEEYADLDSERGASGEFEQEDLSVFDEVSTGTAGSSTADDDEDFDFEQFLEDDEK